MIKVRQIKINVQSNQNVKEKICKILRIDVNDIISYKIVKRSIDARNKPDIYYIYEVVVECKNENRILKRFKSDNIFKYEEVKYNFVKSGNKVLNNDVVIVGSGPCGLFCSYILCENGYKVTILERGADIDTRVNKVINFWKTNKLDLDSNVQFGEGGAGTFSDGKLNTLIKDTFGRERKMFEIFVENGAPSEILYENKPHIGTDILRLVIKNMRQKIIAMGGKFLFNSCMTDINISDNKIKSIIVNDEYTIDTDVLILALGHSARDTFKMLFDKGIKMSPKSFAVGLRVEHLQSEINKSLYGSDNLNIGNASYKLTHTATNGRGVYTFCMCPGGYVVNASSEYERLAINGMSNYKRDSKNANSAVIVTVTPDDFGTHPLSGVDFQRELESKTYIEGKSNIPVQLLGDLKKNRVSTSYGHILPVTCGNVRLSNLNNILPKYIVDAFIEGMDVFDKKIKGFGSDDTLVFGIESRTSSPLRIERTEYESNIGGIFPGGEGAGYAGGITSAGMDGIKIAEQIGKIYKSEK